MQKRTKLLLGLTTAVLFPPCAAAVFFRPEKGLLAMLIFSGLIGAVTVWQFLVKSFFPLPAVPPPAKPNPFLQLQVERPDMLYNQLASAVENILTTLPQRRETISLAEIRQELRSRLSSFFEKKEQTTTGVVAKEVTVVLTDLRGFTNITENYSALEVVDMLNRFFTIMCEIIYRHGGIVDKYVGDSIMALFGAPISKEEDVVNALCCAVEMQIAMNDFNLENKNRGIPDQYIGIGINTGQVIAGRIGSALHSEYTVIGDEINLTSRIEAYSLRGQILISNNTYSKAKDLVTVSDPIHISVKGKRGPVCIYELQGLGPPYNLTVPTREDRLSRRVEIDTPFKFQICIDKIVSSDTHAGRIRNISTGGMLVYTFTEVEPHWNIKFRLDSQITGIEGDDIYGKIIRAKKREDFFEANIEFTAINSKDSAAIKELVNRTLKSSLLFSI